MLTLLGIWNTAPLYTPVLASHFKSWMIVWSLTWGTVCPGKQGICYFSHFCLLSCFISAFVLRCESAYKKSIHPLQIMACAVMWPQKLFKKKKKGLHTCALTTPCLFIFIPFTKGTGDIYTAHTFETIYLTIFLYVAKTWHLQKGCLDFLYPLHLLPLVRDVSVMSFNRTVLVIL